MVSGTLSQWSRRKLTTTHVSSFRHVRPPLVPAGVRADVYQGNGGTRSQRGKQFTPPIRRDLNSPPTCSCLVNRASIVSYLPSMMYLGPGTSRPPRDAPSGLNYSTDERNQRGVWDRRTRTLRTEARPGLRNSAVPGRSFLFLATHLSPEWGPRDPVRGRHVRGGREPVEVGSTPNRRSEAVNGGPVDHSRSVRRPRSTGVETEATRVDPKV